MDNRDPKDNKPVTSYTSTLFSRAAASYETAKNLIFFDYYKAFQKFMLGDLNENFDVLQILKERAHIEETANVGIAHIGPPMLGFNIALIDGTYIDDPKEYEKQLNAVVNLSDESSRVPYEILNLISGANFLLADNTSNAMAMHKKISRYLKPRAILQEFKQEMPTLLEQDPQSILNERLKYDPTSGIGIMVTNCFAKILFGVKPTPKLVAVINSLLQSLDLKNTLLPLLVKRYIPTNAFSLRDKCMAEIVKRFYPDLIQKRAEVDEACREFIREKSEELQTLIAAGESNMLIDAIKALIPEDKDLRSMSKAELDALADQADVRGAIFSLFAVDNAAYTITGAANSAMHFLKEPRIIELQAELDQQSELDATKLSDKSRVTLQALYNMVVVLNSKFGMLFRYTEKGIQQDKMNIPANSFILCELIGYNNNFDRFNKMFAGRNFILQYFNQESPPSQEELETVKKQKCITDKEIMPIIFQLKNDPNYYVYGIQENNNWQVSNLGQLPALTQEMIQERLTPSTQPYEVDSFYSKVLEKAITDQHAHLPFEQLERSKYTMGEGKFNLFGKGARKCPAAADVSTLCKHLIITIIKNYEFLNKKIVRRHVEPEPDQALKSTPKLF